MDDELTDARLVETATQCRTDRNEFWPPLTVLRLVEEVQALRGLARDVRDADFVATRRNEIAEDDYCVSCGGSRPKAPWADPWEPPAVVHTAECLAVRARIMVPA